MSFEYFAQKNYAIYLKAVANKSNQLFKPIFFGLYSSFLSRLLENFELIYLTSHSTFGFFVAPINKTKLSYLNKD